MRIARSESDAGIHRTSKALRAKSLKLPIQFREALEVRTRLRVAFYLPLRLLQLLPNLAFFATDIAEMALEKG
jgi:hypothetical protein